MAEEMICPKCGNFSYTAAPYEPSPCPYCGYIFCKTHDEEDAAKPDKEK